MVNCSATSMNWFSTYHVSQGSKAVWINLWWIPSLSNLQRNTSAKIQGHGPLNLKHRCGRVQLLSIAFQSVSVSKTVQKNQSHNQSSISCLEFLVVPLENLYTQQKLLLTAPDQDPCCSFLQATPRDAKKKKKKKKTYPANHWKSCCMEIPVLYDALPIPTAWGPRARTLPRGGSFPYSNHLVKTTGC